jgi:hypothetical protein
MDAIKLHLDAGGKSACGREREINVANHKHVVWVWVWVWEESLIGRGDRATDPHHSNPYLHIYHPSLHVILIKINPLYISHGCDLMNNYINIFIFMLYNLKP